MTPIVDTGPLLAMFDRSDRHHRWAELVFSELRGPLVTCEAVVAEVSFLCARNRISRKPLDALILSGAVRVLPTLSEDHETILRLMERYSSVPMSVADACLLWMHETTSPSAVITCDSDFRIYRRSRKRPVDALIPDDV
ncbi:MAG: type II toxin-antitoxin system VapC family toxin [Archangium sp.]